MDSYIKLAVATILPVIFAVVFYLLDTKTSFGKINYWVKQVIYGIAFGAVAILGTEYGIPMNGAQVNVRDAAVLAAGLFFGGPAGIIAGLIGGIERWIAVAWGIGTFTRVACSVSTALCGFVAAGMRRFLFDGTYPNWVMGFASGAVMETFHMTMVFLTNLDNTEKAISVIKSCMFPMIVANAISVMIGSFVLRVLSKQRVSVFKRDSVKITDTVQRSLIIVIVIALVLSGAFIVELQSQSSDNEVEKYLRLACEDTENDVNDAVESAIREVAYNVSKDLEETDINEVAARYGVTEINDVNDKGVIINSTNPDYFGFDFHSGEQSAEFLKLLDGEYYLSQEYGPIAYDATVFMKYSGIATKTGFIQVGYNAQGFQRLIESRVQSATANTHVGEKGFVVILNDMNIIVSQPKFVDDRSISYTYLLGQFSDEEMPAENEVFDLTILGTSYYGRYHLTNGYTVLAVMDANEAALRKDIATYASNFMEVLIFAVLFILIYNLIKQVVVKQLRKVTGSLRKIASGDLNEVVTVRDNEEFATLSDDINSTVNKLKEYIDEAAARIDADLAMAKEIQLSALPAAYPTYQNRKDFNVYARMDTAKEVGGDFYDFYLTHHNEFNFLIADVSGKGIPAAMFMMRAKTQLQSLTKAGKPINEVFTTGNNALCEGNDAGMFVTAWQGGINLDSGLVQFANGGHNPPVLKRANGQFEYLKNKVNLVLAGMPEMPYAKQEFRMNPGDILYLYTDGITEATDAHNELFGEDRLLKALNSKEFTSMQDVCDTVKAAVDEFVGEAPQFDDMTMVAFQYNGPEDDEEVILKDKKVITVPAKVAALGDLMQFVDENLEQMECPMKNQTQIDIAVDEIFANISSYAYESGEGDFIVEMYPCKETRGVKLRFIDTGVPYNPLTHEDPDITLSAEERGIGGLGILMVKNTMTKVDYEYTNGKNILTLTKHFE